jgi:hypothetical protein
LIVVGAITNGDFQSGRLHGNDRDDRKGTPGGFASAVNHVTFGLGHGFGVGFEHHSSAMAAAITTAQPAEFAAAMNVTFLPP